MSLITFLSAHPDRAFGLSELARRLDLNKATAHAMLLNLTRAGWLVRAEADKTYRLGPSLVAIGAAAAGPAQRALEVARPSMRRLSDELGVQVVASTVMGDEIVVLAVEGPTDTGLGAASRPGYRVPLAPPLGTVFMAWSDPDGVEHWLHELRPNLDAARSEAYRRAIDVVRRRGYAVTLAGDHRRNLGQALSALAADVSNADFRATVERVIDAMGVDDDYLLVDFVAMDSYQLGMISAPVFDSAGHVALAITLTAFPRRLTSRQVPQHARRLTTVTAAVTAAIGGRSR